MWVGDTVYFLSDRSGTTNLFSYDPRTKQVAQLTRHDDFDIMSASAGPDAIVYEQAGYIHLVDTATRKAQRLAIEVTADFPWARPQLKKVASMIRSAVLSPTGVRAAFEARGDIHTLPGREGTGAQSHGECRRARSQPGVVARRRPDRVAVGRERRVSVDDRRADRRHQAARDTAALEGVLLGAGVVARRQAAAARGQPSQPVEPSTSRAGTAAKIDTDTYDDPGRRFDAAWSPDSQWVAYSKSLASHLRAIFLYSIADRKAYQVTDGLSDAVAPAFDASGKYLYFLASTNYALRTGWLEMSSVDRPVTRAIYLAVLSASEPSPFLPETGDETVAPPPNPAAAQPGGQATGRSEGAGSSRGPHRSRGHRPADPGARRARRRLQRADARQRRHAVLRGNAARGGQPRADRPSLSTAGTQGGAVPRGRSLVYALGRREAAALSRRRQPLGHRPHRASGEGRRGRHRCRHARGAGRSARRVGADLPRDLAHPARVLLRRIDARRGLAGALREVPRAAAVRRPPRRPGLSDCLARR